MSFKVPLSLAERDRRWAAVRQRMAAEGLDYLIGLPNGGHYGGFQAETAYLAPGVGDREAALIFPLEGEPTAYTVNDASADDWAEAQDWFSDVRSAGRTWGQPIARNLQERGFHRGRLGILGLTNVLRAPEGVVPWGSVEKLRQSFPEAELVSATDLIMSLRTLKSEEEVALIRQATLLAEEGAAAMIQAASEPDATGSEIKARIRYALDRRGSESSLLLFHVGPPSSLHAPSPTLVHPGDILANEIESRLHGYCAQVCQPVAIGPDVPSKWHDNFALNLECWQMVADRMRPGVRLGDVWDAYVKWVSDRGFKTTGWIMHCRGLGEDKPGLHGGTREFDDWTFSENQTFILKPSVLDPSIGTALRFGDTVVVKPNGAERLGVRPPELTVVRQ